MIDCKFIIIFFSHIIAVVHFRPLNRAIQTRGADSVEVKIKPDFGKPKTINNNVFIF